MRGLDPRIHADASRLSAPDTERKRRRRMDCRVKPGNDDGVRHCEERKRRSNPARERILNLDCFASLAMTALRKYYVG
jgi:hypothetical protein